MSILTGNKTEFHFICRLKDTKGESLTTMTSSASVK